MFAVSGSADLRKLDASRCGLLDSTQIKISRDKPEHKSRVAFLSMSRTCGLPGARKNLSEGIMVGFKVGQKVVYPNHGIGTIEQIEQK